MGVSRAAEPPAACDSLGIAAWETTKKEEQGLEGQDVRCTHCSKVRFDDRGPGHSLSSERRRVDAVLLEDSLDPGAADLVASTTGASAAGGDRGRSIDTRRRSR